jgi:putative chitinase
MTPEQLKKIVPGISENNLKTYVPLLNEAFEKYDINTPERQRCFIAQIAHESGSFRYTKEIASGKTYEGRADLGNTEPGDGVKFPGRCLIQCTGRANYRACSLFLFGDERLLEHPELLEEPQNAVDGACWYWTKNKLNEICDKPDNWYRLYRDKKRNKFEWLTIRINGGLNGYKDRLEFYERAKEVIKSIIPEEHAIPKEPELKEPK